MDEAKGQNKNMMVYTPEHRIPLGEAVKTGTSEYALKIKKTNVPKRKSSPSGYFSVRSYKQSERNHE